MEVKCPGVGPFLRLVTFKRNATELGVEARLRAQLGCLPLHVTNPKPALPQGALRFARGWPLGPNDRQQIPDFDRIARGSGQFRDGAGG